jgi:hypothetical protein
MSERNNHPEIDELVDWARGDLPRRRQREIRAHCKTCSMCDLNLAKILVLRTSQRRVMKRRAKRRRQLQMAAAIVILAGTGAVLLLSGHYSYPASELAALATTETIPRSHVGPRFRLAAPASPGGYEAEFKAAMEALVREDYGAGLEILEVLHANHPSEVEISAYLGIARYLAGDDSDHTKALLAQGASHHQDMIRRAAAWYLANSCLRSGDVDSTIQILQTPDLIGTDTRYGNYSADLLRQIEEVQRD